MSTSASLLPRWYQLNRHVPPVLHSGTKVGAARCMCHIHIHTHIGQRSSIASWATHGTDARFTARTHNIYPPFFSTFLLAFSFHFLSAKYKTWGVSLFSWPGGRAKTFAYLQLPWNLLAREEENWCGGWWRVHVPCFCFFRQGARLACSISLSRK